MPTSIAELKTQIENANALGVANLNEKGVIVPNTSTTYEIMQSIAQISGGGGDIVIGADYTNIIYNEDDTITLTDKDGVEHTMACTYQSGKLVGITYDGKEVDLTYIADKLDYVGKTKIDLVDAPIYGLEPLDYTVKFVANHNIYEYVAVVNGNEVDMPSKNPVKYGYVFAGWKDENDNIVDFPIIPSRNMSLHAHFVLDVVTALYENYDVNPDEYEYVVIAYKSTANGDTLSVHFTNNCRGNTIYSAYDRNTLWGLYTTESNEMELPDFTDFEGIVDFVINKIPTEIVQTPSDYSLYNGTVTWANNRNMSVVDGTNYCLYD